MNQWLTSDLHFWHRNVITYCNRPWGSVEEMNEGLIEKWNQNVRDNDLVTVLGDFAMASAGRIAEIVPRLRGHKVLVMGNHDWNYKEKRWLEWGFERVHMGTIRVDKMLLNHFPYRGQQHDQRYFDAMPEDKGEILLHGHVHNAWKRKGRMLNVGVDQWDYRPVNLAEILAQLRWQ